MEAGQRRGEETAPDFRALFQATPGSHLALAPDAPRYTILAASDGYVAATLIDREGVIGRGIFEVFPDANPENNRRTGVATLRASLDRVLMNRARDEMELQRYDVQAPDGTWDVRFWSPCNVPVLGADGEVRYIIHSVDDVTARVMGRESPESRRVTVEHQRLIRELEAERERLRSLILLMPAPVALHMGPEHRIQLVSDAFRQIAGGRDITGMTPREAYPEVEGQGILERFDEVVATGRSWISRETPARFDRRGTGVEETWFDIRYEPVHDATGAVVGVLNFSFDVTEQVSARHEVERLFRESERARAEADAGRERTEAVLSSIADAFYLLDREWRFTYVNDAAEPLLQTTRDQLLGRTLWDAFPGVIGSEFEGPYREAMATGRNTSAEAYFPPLGTWFDVRTYAWAGGLMVHFRDIGERKAGEAERERLLADAELARREAEAANRGKSEFLAVMSHELRTPLNAIGGYVELIELGIRGPITPEQRTDLARIQQSQRHLLGLINGVLNYARVEAGAVLYDVHDVPLDEVLAACEALVSPQVRARGLGLTRSGADHGLLVRADREKLQQIVLNLLSNAIKFTDAGGHVTLLATPDAAAGLVRVEVRDTGIGIASDQVARVFEPFVQVDAKLTRTREGTGLGLAISRDLARGMGGELTVSSAPGTGSVFTLVLPRA